MNSQIEEQFSSSLSLEIQNSLDKCRGRTPIFIPTFNNLSLIQQFLKQLELFGFLYPIIIDNGSEFAPMNEFLGAISEKYGIVLLKNNFGPRFIINNEEIYKILPDIFILSDPDLLLNKRMPTNFLETMKNISEKHRFGKVGLALDISEEANLKNTVFERHQRAFTIVQQEERFWLNRIDFTAEGDPIYVANTDTTFCVYNKAHFRRDSFFRALRVAGVYTCQHLPWRQDFFLPNDEEEFYRKHQRHSTYLGRKS